MSIHCALHHQTAYRYDRPVLHGPQLVRLRPAPHHRNRVLAYSLRVGPQPHFLSWQQDPHGNFLARVVFPEPIREFSIEVDLVADMATVNPFDFFVDEHATTLPFRYEAWQREELLPFLQTGDEGLGPRFAALLEDWRPPAGSATVDYLVGLNQHLSGIVRYLIRMEPGVQTPEQTLASGAGSCRDSAWLLVRLLRRLGLAARFVSGYLIQLKPDVKPLEGPGGTEVDFCDLHAWAEAYLPGAGWVGMDPTSGLLTGEGHIPLASTPDPRSAAPVSGSIEAGAEAEFRFSMNVNRLRETARVTKPYTAEQWQLVLQTGSEIDRVLQQQDVRLTMGGEPTFVSAANSDEPEWTVAALGEEKLQVGEQLLRRLWQRYGNGGFLHHGQGKWYPGEPLPRWAWSCYWRRDGGPLWRDPSLLAEEGRDYGHSPEQGGRFIRHLAGRLGVPADHLMPAFEDAWYYLWRERRLPANLNPLESKLEDEQERERLARVFEQGLDHEVGHVLPLCRNRDGSGWTSPRWTLRTETLFLIPGDSPIGYRLPLESLPWTDQPAGHGLELEPLDPWVERPPLPPGRVEARLGQPLGPAEPRVQHPLDAGSSRVGGSSAQRAEDGDGAGDDPHGGPADGATAGAADRSRGDEPENDLLPTALCVEPRGGVLRVFMPPTARLEDYLELVAAIEDTAAELELPVLLEGYRPPPDPRLRHFSLAPDPGVLEVNLQPVAGWDEAVDLTQRLYEEARLCRLATEKFALDGRHCGTGGGNHIVLGGATPADSPFLRRPDLLASMIRYWHNHPSLSYLFSGLFVGPTSQAPRVDEARPDAIYELETALAELPPHDAVAAASPWLVDRILRNHLVDLTGNTHRAEFCIDKLYSPDSSTGRLGLLELRAFEMPPHAQMSLTQQLLVRAMVARFWRQPYRQRLVRWGSALNDRWALPHFIWQDFSEIIEEFRALGFGLDAEWFRPHFEFRFPQLGEYARLGVQVELRQAVEPWHVLGEELSAGGTARYVDSSVERLQVLVRGMTGERHLLTCNGRPLPLHPTGRNSEFVAGVRYKAWAPHSALHPTKPVVTPLTIDLIDSWNRRAIGGCRYHVMHPAGRSYDRFPVNAFEAESRRLARFEAHGHTPGTVDVAGEPLSMEFPFTLDLQSER